LLYISYIVTVLAVYSNKMQFMDRINNNLIRQLQKDGRLTNQELSERVSLSPSPCMRRVRKLEESGIITGYTAIVDNQKCGFLIKVFISVRLEKHTEEIVADFEAGVQELDEVLACYLISGSRDYLLQVVAKDLDDYQHFLRKKLRQVPGIGQLESNFVMEKIKKTALLPNR